MSEGMVYPAWGAPGMDGGLAARVREEQTSSGCAGGCYNAGGGGYHYGSDMDASVQASYDHSNASSSWATKLLRNRKVLEGLRRECQTTASKCLPMPCHLFRKLEAVFRLGPPVLGTPRVVLGLAPAFGRGQQAHQPLPLLPLQQLP